MAKCFSDISGTIMLGRIQPGNLMDVQPQTSMFPAPESAGQLGWFCFRWQVRGFFHVSFILRSGATVACLQLWLDMEYNDH